MKMLNPKACIRNLAEQFLCLFSPGFFLMALFALIAGLPGCTSEPAETELLLIVDFTNVPDNMILTGFHTDKVEIKIKSSPRTIELLKNENIRYPVDLYTDLEFDPAGDSNSIEPGAYLIPVEEKRIPLGSRKIQILEIEPSYLSVQLERKVSKTVKVSIPCLGDPANGYILLEPIAEPSSVTLSGPGSVISAIEELKTKPVDISNTKETIQAEIPLDLNKLASVHSPVKIISAKIPVHQLLIQKSIENIPVSLLSSGEKATIEPETINITIKGPFEKLSNKQIMDQIHSFVDIKDLKPGIYARHAYINIPAGLMMTDAQPKVFTIKIEG